VSLELQLLLAGTIWLLQNTIWYMLHRPEKIPAANSCFRYSAAEAFSIADTESGKKYQCNTSLALGGMEG
jgi:hypothetical protein